MEFVFNILHPSMNMKITSSYWQTKIEPVKKFCPDSSKCSVWHVQGRLRFPHFSAVSWCYLSTHPLLSSLPPLQGKVSQFPPSCPLLQLSDRKCVCECPPVSPAGMNMPLHQISVIPRDVTSSRVCGNGKAKDKDKQVWAEPCWQEFPLVLNCCLKVIQLVWRVASI